MIVAIPTYENRVSPVMDTAANLMVIELEGDLEKSRTVIAIPALHPVRVVRFIADRGIDVLICGAISNMFAAMLTSSGVKIIPWVRGTIDEIITAFVNNTLDQPEFFLPGCMRRMRQGGQGGRGGGRGRGRRLGTGRGGGRRQM